jgi:exopolysaccharide production protein ExoQ
LAEPPMRSLTRSNAHPQIDGLIYSKSAELLFICLLLIFIYPFFFVISGVDPTIPIEEQSQSKLVYFLQLVVPLLCIAIALMCRGSAICLPGAIMIYPIVCLASTIWSVGPYDTFKYATLMFLYIFAVAAVCQLLDIAVFCKIIVKVLAFLILASVVMAIAFPKYGTHQLDNSIGDVHEGGLWRGVFVHKNSLGAAASTAVFVFLFLPRLVSASVGFRVMCIVAAIACLIFAQSASSWVALCMVVVYYFLIRTVPVSRNCLVALFLGVTALAYASFSFFGGELVALVGRDMTLTGRTDIWLIVLDAVGQRPLLGFGYAAATDFIRPILLAEIGSAAVDAHSGYLDALLGTGIAGLAALLFGISSVIVRGIGRVKMSAGRETDCLMLLLSFPILSLLSAIFEVEPISGVQGVLGALTYLSLTALPLYLRLERANYQSPTSAAHGISSATIYKL